MDEVKCKTEWTAARGEDYKSEPKAVTKVTKRIPAKE